MGPKTSIAIAMIVAVVGGVVIFKLVKPHI